jgi:hypothetical protein
LITSPKLRGKKQCSVDSVFRFKHLKTNEMETFLLFVLAGALAGSTISAALPLNFEGKVDLKYEVLAGPNYAIDDMTGGFLVVRLEDVSDAYGKKEEKII